MPSSDDRAAVGRRVIELTQQCLAAYRANPGLVEEHANIERSITQGGYGRRQLYELVQNGADELQREPGGGIRVVLTDTALYCANRGTAITVEGIETILASHLSRKRGTEIGRFGLGFKSVLSVSDSPSFLSERCSFGWDRGWAEATIRSVNQTTGPTPVLRIARLLDLDSERADDPVLDELMTWAVTVIRLPLLGGHHERLSRELREFPGDFVIFSPHIGRLELQDRASVEPYHRIVTVSGDGDERLIHEQADGTERVTAWKVFERIHTPSGAARRAAGEFHDRHEVPLSWAVPLSGGQGLGAFWAFFPTTYETTLSGILNAPWKTNEDRQNLLKDNLFNDELMAAAAELVVESLPALSSRDDPARHLAHLTARGREGRNWADKELSGSVYKLAAQRPSLPDQTGRLRRPAEVKLHPARLEPHWLQLWRSAPSSPDDWCHHSVEETVRRSRAELILNGASLQSASVRRWLTALVADKSPSGSIAALRIVADMVEKNHPLADEARTARIVLTADGTLACVGDPIFRRTPGEAEADDLVYIDPVLDDDHDLDRALSDLGLQEADPAGRLVSFLQTSRALLPDDGWEEFWSLARRIAPAAVRDILEDVNVAYRVKVRTREGRFAGLRECLLPGRVLTGDSPAAVDLDYHREDEPVLRLLGLSDVPDETDDPSQDAWFADYKRAMIGEYYHALPPEASRPSDRSLRVTGASPAGPLALLLRLTPAEIARFLQHMPPGGIVSNWRVVTTKRADRGLHVPSPLLWLMRRIGYASTSWGVLPLADCVGPEFQALSDRMPVADLDLGLANVLGLPASADLIDVPRWARIVNHAEEHLDDEALGDFYGFACRHLPAPSSIRCQRGKDRQRAEPRMVTVVVGEEQLRRLMEHGMPALPASEDAARELAASWGLSHVKDVLVTEIRAVPSREPVLVEEMFPRLRLLAGRPLQDVSLVGCSDLDELIDGPNGRSVHPTTMAKVGSAVYSVEPADDNTVLRGLRDLFGLDLTDRQCDQAVVQREQRHRNARIEAAREQDDDAGRLLTLLGADVLRTRLPQAVLEAVTRSEGVLSDRTIAELALDVFGTTTLREYHADLERLGVDVPPRWAGGHGARQLVADLGFPAAFAGEREPILEASVLVEGPTPFPKLHPYQRVMVDRMRSVVESRPPRRGMLCLPTGAGKTRTAVQALIESMRDGALRHRLPILWIAQSNELCEQAVQSWLTAWRSLGDASRLTIARHWASNPADPVADGFHLVVATDAQLARSIEKPDYEWLRLAQCVVIDEAHTSLSPRYTTVLGSLGITPYRTRCPLIGLTATPFRSTNVEETERLTNRYNKNRIDFDDDGREILGTDPYRTLQDMGMLALVEHRELPGTVLRLTDGEKTAATNYRRLPRSAEMRLGADQDRTEMLVQEIAGLPDDWPVLVFAASVDHAYVLAALLNRRGVPSASIDAATDDGVRRRRIRSFREGHIRVLTNYSVLSQGFDAPATRAIVVARPTYSPNAYQQMIGRGLRGPLNRGKEKCLVLDVADNITQFGARPAFRDFEFLWQNPAGG